MATAPQPLRAGHLTTPTTAEPDLSGLRRSLDNRPDLTPPPVEKILRLNAEKRIETKKDKPPSAEDVPPVPGKAEQVR
ncbi:MAG: hypothetical protein AAB817_02120 [Patescibacteria group bacterium]